MWLSFLLSALSLLLTVLCAIDVYKNFMKERRNISGISLTIVVVLLVVAVLYSLFSGSKAFWLQHFLRMIDNPANYDPKELANAAASIPVLKTIVIKQLLYGYGFYAVQFIYMYILRRNVDKNIQTNKKGKWTFK